MALCLSRAKTGLVVAEVDCRLGEGTVRRPDLSVFLGSHATEFDWQRIPILFAPDIAVEVNRKVLDYLAAGGREVWLLDEASSEIYIQSNSGIRLLRGDEPLETPLLPGFHAFTSDLLSA